MNRTYQAFENIRYTESELKKRGYKPLYIGLYGSDNYDLNTAESDYDFKAIVAPTIKDFIRGKQVSTTIELPLDFVMLKILRICSIVGRNKTLIFLKSYSQIIVCGMMIFFMI